MAAYYLDTSALVKRYVFETGTSWIQSLTARRARHTLFTACVTGPEIVAAFGRKARTGEVSRGVAAQAGANFRQDWGSQYQIIEVSVRIADHAMDLAENHGLRGYDAVHLAAALDVQARRQAAWLAALTFVSADIGQIQAAMAEGLAVDDPNAHP